MRQQPEALHDHLKIIGHAEKILDDHIEAFATKPMEGIKHYRRRPVHPSVVHIHSNELVQKWAVFRRASAGVLRHYIIGRVQIQVMPICYSASNGGFSRATSPADPVHMAQLFA
jgi:hypothetical protein